MSTRKLMRVIVSMFMAFAIAAMVFCGTLMQPVGASYRNWKQTDPQWSSIRLGNSSETMGASGCVVTSYSMLLVLCGAVKDPGFTPEKAVAILNQCGAFDSEGELQWKALEKTPFNLLYAGRVDFDVNETQAEKTAMIQKKLNEGCRVMVQVRTTYKSRHFVAVDHISNGNVYILDPAFDVDVLFDGYANVQVESLRLFQLTGSTGTTEASQEAPPAPGLAPPPAPAQTTAATAENPPSPGMENPPSPGMENPPSLGLGNPPSPGLENPPSPGLENPPSPGLESPPAPEQAVVVVTTNPPAPDPETPPAPSAEETSTEAVPVMPETTTEAAPETPMLPPALPSQKLPLPEELDAAQFICVNQMVQANRTLVLKDMPYADAEGMLIIPEGTELKVVWIALDNAWGMVEFDGTVGWISLDYVIF